MACPYRLNTLYIGTDRVSVIVISIKKTNVVPAGAGIQDAVDLYFVFVKVI